VSGNDREVKQSTVERQTNDLLRSSNGKLSSEQAKRIARDSAERVNRERREKK
jgi:hypothetical protein